MTQVQVSNQWHLKQNEIDTLMANGKGTKVNWWMKNLTTNQFVNYQEQTGTRFNGGMPFNALLELEPGEYMCACGDYQLMSPDGRHCSQVFYIYVNETEGHVCKKSELPSNGGNGGTPNQNQTQLNPSWGDNVQNTTNTSWGATPPKTVEYFVIPGFKACMQDMAVRAGFEGCDDCEQIDLTGNLDCTNCRHALDVYVKKA